MKGWVCACLLCLMLPILGGCWPAAIVAGGTVVTATATQERGASGFVSDTWIQAQVCHLWAQEQTDRFSAVSSVIHNGIVLLTGCVRNPSDKTEAGLLVRPIKGVVAVHNHLHVGSGSGSYAQDAWITTKLKAKLLVDRMVLYKNYKLCTADRVVYVLGVAQDNAELERVLETAKNIAGVLRVIHYVKIKPSTNDSAS